MTTTTPPLIQNELDEAIDLVLTENRQVLKAVDLDTIAQLSEAISQSKRIFVTGEGRSGLVLRMFAMRLMHLGCQDFVVGETITPSIQAGDLLIDCSGSGNTDGVLAIAQKAQAIGARIVSITTQSDSPLGQLADIVIHLNAATKQDRSRQHSQQFAGSLFEQSTLLLLDALFHVLARQTNQSAETLYGQHANLE
jgi:6-phospho-3-hexuloisomerase